MDIAVVGLGYVGTVSAACLASAGHTVWGVDINEDKVRMINECRSPIVEENLGAKIAQARKAGRLYATCKVQEALAQSRICFVAVATPSRANGDIDAKHLLRACEQICAALTVLRRSQIVVIRSSILPFIFDQCRLKFSSLPSGLVRFCVNPEFLREGTAIADFENPPFTLLGVEDQGVETALRDLYKTVPAPLFVLPPREALMVKYTSNAYHALKTAFANEIGTLCRRYNIDGESVLSVFCRDRKLNISERYLLPGFAFGGSCLPKDVRAVSYAAKRVDLDLPLLESLLLSNERVIHRAVLDVCCTGARKIGLIGLGFKANTDDLRESPYVEVAERLLGKGYALKIYDPNVSHSLLMGANRQYIETVIPHLSCLLVSRLEELGDCEMLVVGHRYPGVDSFLSAVQIPVTVLSVCSATPSNELHPQKNRSCGEELPLMANAG